MSGAVCVGQRLSPWWVLSGGGPVALPAAGLPYLQAPGPVRCEQDVFSWLEVEDSVGAHCSALTWLCHQNIHLALQMRALESQKYKDDPFSSGHLQMRKPGLRKCEWLTYNA